MSEGEWEKGRKRERERMCERERENEIPAVIITHSFIISDYASDLFPFFLLPFVFFFAGSETGKRWWHENLKSLFYNENRAPFNFFFFSPCEKEWNWKGNSIFVGISEKKIWKEETDSFTVSFYISLFLHSKIEIESAILILFFILTRFSPFGRFSLTMTMPRWGCCVSHACVSYLHRKCAHSHHSLPSALNFTMRATNDESEWFLFSFLFVDEKKNTWRGMIL